MFLRLLTVPVKSIQGVNSTAAVKLARLGIQNVRDLLVHYPRDWEDREKPVLINGFKNSKVCTVVTVLARDWIRYGAKRTLKVYVEDESARAALICYNRPWLGKLLVPGERFMLWGSFNYRYGEIQSGYFEVEHVSLETNNIKNSLGNIVPVYPLTTGLSQSQYVISPHALLSNTRRILRTNFRRKLLSVIIYCQKIWLLNQFTIPPHGTS